MNTFIKCMCSFIISLQACILFMPMLSKPFYDIKFSTLLLAIEIFALNLILMKPVHERNVITLSLSVMHAILYSEMGGEMVTIETITVL